MRDKMIQTNFDDQFALLYVPLIITLRNVQNAQGPWMPTHQLSAKRNCHPDMECPSIEKANPSLGEGLHKARAIANPPHALIQARYQQPHWPHPNVKSLCPPVLGSCIWAGFQLISKQFLG
jgi:hypothetical protein